MTDRAGQDGSERGSALVYAIALSAVFAGLAILSIQIVLSSAFLTRDHRDEAELDAALRSAMAEAFWRLQDRSDPVRYEEWQTIAVAGQGLRYRFFAPAGRVDINQAGPVLLRPLLAAAGAEDPAALADAIVDWRDGDSLRSLNGAEAADYRSAGRTGPANRPFRDPGELGDVLGMTPGVLACLIGQVTVSTGALAPDLSLSDDTVRAAYRSGAGSDVTGGERNNRRPPVTPGSGDLVGLHLDVTDGRFAGRGADILVRLTGNPRDPYWIQGFDAVMRAGSACAGAGNA